MIKTKYPTTKPSLNLDFANTKSLDPRITFRRGTPGTYYDGVTHVKAEENLIYPSIPNSTDWTINDISCVENYSSDLDPEGGNTATLITTNSGTNNTPYIFAKKTENASNDKFTHSVFVKPVTHNYVQLSINSQGSVFANFDLSTDQGEVGNIGEGVTASINSFTNGWYRISMTYTSNGHVNGSLVRISLQGSTSDLSIDSWNPSGSESVLVWGAQSELRDTVTSYTATNGTSITKYQPKLMTAAADHARFDHDPITGESKGLLIEESRTNLAWHSVDFGERAQLNGLTPLPVHGWMYVRCSIDTNGPMSPDGTRSVVMNHDTTETNGGGLFISGHSDYDDKYIPAGTNTYSFYAKNAGVNFFVMNTGGNKIFFDLTNGTAKSFATLIDSYGIEHVGNGWYRCHVVTSQATGLYFYQSDQDDDGTQTVSGAGGVAVWGPQFEQGSFPTSYIKTTGASATRSADNASITGENFSSWYRQDEGSIYVDSGKGKNDTSFAGYVALHTEDFSAMEYYWILHRIPTDQFQLLVAPGIANLTDGIDTSLSSQKACVSWADDDFSMSVNGNTIQSDTDGPAKKNLTGLRIGFSPYSKSHYLNSTIKKLAYYPQRLTNEQLQNLTK
jgi:hypothetical protein